MTQFASDAFSYTVGATLQSQSSNWLKHPAAGDEIYCAPDGRIRGSTSATSLCYNTAVPPSADYSVKADIVFISTVTTVNAGICGRLNSTANTSYWGRYVQGTGWQLYKTVAGTSTQLGSSVSETFTSGTKEIKLVMQGTTIALYNEGEATPVISVTDSAITAAGYAGVRMGGATVSGSSGYHLDNWSADTLDAGSVDATATGATLTGTSTLTPGGASGGSGAVDASAPGATLTGSASLSAGAATGGSSGTFVSEVLINNTDSLMASVAVVWEWRKGVGIGVAPVSVTYGTGTTNASGILTVSGLPAGAGEMLVASPDYVDVCYQRGTVS